MKQFCRFLLMMGFVLTACGKPESQKPQALIISDRVSIAALEEIQANCVRIRSQLEDIALAGPDGTDDYEGWCQRKSEQFAVFYERLQKIKSTVRSDFVEVSPADRKLLNGFPQLRTEVDTYWQRVGFPVTVMTEVDLRTVRTRLAILAKQIKRIGSYKIDSAMEQDRDLKVQAFSITFESLRGKLNALRGNPDDLPIGEEELLEKALKAHLPRFEKRVQDYEQKMIAHPGR